MRVESLRAARVIAVGLLLAGSAQAAPIVWDDVQNISGPGGTTIVTSKTQGGPGVNQTIANGTNDVSTLGTQVFGINFSGTSGSTYPYSLDINNQFFYSFRDPNPFPVSYSATGVVNTYSFFSTPGAAGQSYGKYDSAGVGPNPDYVLANGAYSDSPNGTITFGNLTPGNTYLVQLWVTDPRGGTLSTRNETVASSTGGDTNAPTLAYAAPGSTDGQWVIGRFVAEGSGTQTLVLTGGNAGAGSGSAQVNLLQLRDITAVPEPTALAAMAFGALGILVHRRRA